MSEDSKHLMDVTNNTCCSLRPSSPLDWPQVIYWVPHLPGSGRLLRCRDFYNQIHHSQDCACFPTVPILYTTKALYIQMLPLHALNTRTITAHPSSPASTLEELPPLIHPEHRTRNRRQHHQILDAQCLRLKDPL